MQYTKTAKKRRYKFIVKNLCLMMLTLFWLFAMQKSVLAETNISSMSSGRAEMQREEEIDVEGHVENDESLKNSSQATNSSGATLNSTKPSTNNVGNGINDKVSANAKTGDFFSGKNLVIFLLAAGGIIVIINLRKGKNAER